MNGYAESKAQDSLHCRSGRYRNAQRLLKPLHVYNPCGKGQKDRYVPIGSRALAWIARYVDQAREKLCVDPNEQTLFLTVEGKPLQPDSLTEYASRYTIRN